MENKATIHSTADSAPGRFGTVLSKLIAPFAKRFIAGTTLSEAIEVVKRMEAAGFRTTLDHLGESVTSREEATQATDKYVIILKALKEHKLDIYVSVKLTQLGLDIDRELCTQNLRRIVEAADQVKGFVRVDMEGSDKTSDTLDIIRALKTNRAVPLGAVLQAMLLRTPEDMVKLMQKEVPIRLCKGAYKEPPDIALQDMVEIQKQFLALAKRLLTSGGTSAIATHDPWLIEGVQGFAKEHGIDASRFEFQMLYGIRRRLQRRIRDEGYRIRIYVPFGRAWLPYMWRRLRERKENMLFFVKHLFVR
jgi:proline dehydrogenase